MRGQISLHIAQQLNVSGTKKLATRSFRCVISLDSCDNQVRHTFQSNDTVYFLDLHALCRISKFFEDSYKISNADREGKQEAKPLVFNALEKPVFEVFALLAHAGCVLYQAQHLLLKLWESNGNTNTNLYH